ncbi:acetyl-CoA synthetase-like protein [Vararia minispora EC-137]|uniref:Acetyl-CoA synthetase-like protein n=1 Tax=Vararia minispora EC-137 TaxID=1314806 RepID=A0ACB8QZP8_9AGAM|nr:acetyl-CoA synthetase-like protein [Vararia minispora EC-137]
MPQWVPKRSLAEVEAILTGPGALHEVEQRVIHNKIMRTYKNAWSSLRDFWMWAVEQHSDKTYIVFERTRVTFSEGLHRSAVIAAMLQDLYDIQKGDRVSIVSRNTADYLLTFWACHLIGAVPVLVNAWLPLEPTFHCIVKAGSKLVIMDGQRADSLEGAIQSIKAKIGTEAFLVWEEHEGKGTWPGMSSWTDVYRDYGGDHTRILKTSPNIYPEDNACIMFTSGTTGLPKGVLNTQRMYITNILNVFVGGLRATLRRGDSISASPPAGPQKGLLISVPFFHVTGTTTLSSLATMAGYKICLIRKWVPEEGRLSCGCLIIRQENVAVAGGVPSMVSDLVISSAAGYPLDTLLFGGASPPDWLARDSMKAFPTAMMSQGYGLTETNSIAVAVAGEDYACRPTCAGLPSPVNEVAIVKGDKVLPPGELGEVWLRGPNVMKEYWDEPAATAKALTADGWLRSGDIGYLDDEGFLYIRDRIKDLIIRGGENIDSTTVENAASADSRLLEVAAVGVPDSRLGELVTVVAYTKPEFSGKVDEAEVIEIASQRLPKFAVPVMVMFLSEPLPRNAPGKILKNVLRPIAKAEWERRRVTQLSKNKL